MERQRAPGLIWVMLKTRGLPDSNMAVPGRIIGYRGNNGWEKRRRLVNIRRQIFWGTT